MTTIKSEANCDNEPPAIATDKVTLYVTGITDSKSYLTSIVKNITQTLVERAGYPIESCTSQGEISLAIQVQKQYKEIFLDLHGTRFSNVNLEINEQPSETQQKLPPPSSRPGAQLNANQGLEIEALAERFNLVLRRWKKHKKSIKREIRALKGGIREVLKASNSQRRKTRSRTECIRPLLRQTKNLEGMVNQAIDPPAKKRYEIVINPCADHGPMCMELSHTSRVGGDTTQNFQSEAIANNHPQKSKRDYDSKAPLLPDPRVEELQHTITAYNTAAIATIEENFQTMQDTLKCVDPAACDPPDRVLEAQVLTEICQHSKALLESAQQSSIAMLCAGWNAACTMLELGEQIGTTFSTKDFETIKEALEVVLEHAIGEDVEIQG